MDLLVRKVERPGPGELPVEIVERKGRGHPDSICDALAEEISRKLCVHYQDRFGGILHHNVDKILLCGGSSRPVFGGGEVLVPIELYLGGRATSEFRGEHIPVDEIAVDACRGWLRQNLPELDSGRHVTIVSRIRPGSGDLTRLFARGAAESPLANDTSCAVGFAPFTDLERVVLEVERSLTSDETRRARPAIGPDVKVMGVRRERRIALTVGCAIVSRYVQSPADYQQAKAEAANVALSAAGRVTSMDVDVTVNAADDLSRGEMYLTVTGTSAESGDDGEVGRGNRSSGLITPYRGMSLEAAAGKNPLTHVGKLYNVVAASIAAAIARELPGAPGATCVLLSRIGTRTDDPRVADVQLELAQGTRLEDVSAGAERIVRRELSRLPELRAELVAGRITVF